MSWLHWSRHKLFPRLNSSSGSPAAPWYQSLKGFLALGQTGPAIPIKEGNLVDNNHRVNVIATSANNKLGILGSVLSLRQRDIDSQGNNVIVGLADRIPLSNLHGNLIVNHHVPVALPLNFILTSDTLSSAGTSGSTHFSQAKQVSSSLSNNLTMDQVTKKVPRSLTDECPNVETKNIIEKRVTRSVRADGRYKNPWDTWNENSFRISSLMRFGMSRDHSGVPNKVELDKLLPIEKPSFVESSPEKGVRVTWIGHSTLVAQFDGFTVLTDPIFSARASPSQLFGPRRYRDPACSISDLPNSLNAVVISHNHYDHLDVSSITALHQRYGSSLSWYVPMGLKTWFESIGIKHAVEMDWWDEICHNGNITIAFTPTQHWSKRGISDDFVTLWGSWTFIGPKERFFFTGDTGYCPVFKEIGSIYGPFTVSAIPIGAYEPRWFMKAQHVDPDEAVQIHQDLNSRASVAIHWGTFALANEFFLDPPLKLKSSLEKLNLSDSEFVALKHGESKTFPLGPIEGRETFNRLQQSIITHLQETQVTPLMNSTLINYFLNYVNYFFS